MTTEQVRERSSTGEAAAAGVRQYLLQDTKARHTHWGEEKENVISKWLS